MSLAETAERLRRAYDDRFRVEEPQQKKSRIAKMLVGLNTAMTAASGIAVLIAMFLIYNTMLISIVQRKVEIGTLRALGTRARDATRLLTLEGSLIGGVGSLLGLGLGIVLARVMLGGLRDSVGQIYMNVGQGKLRYDAGLLVLCFALGSAATGFAAFIAARSAARVPPVESLSGAASAARYLGRTRLSVADVSGLMLIALVPILTSAPRWSVLPIGEIASAPSLMLGAALLAPRAVQLLHAIVARAGRSLGVTTLMANQNLTRDLMRTAITAGALILGMGMATSFAVFISSFVKSANDWVEQSISADLFVTSAAPGLVTHTPLPAEIGVAIARLPRVRAVEYVRMADLQFRNGTVKLMSISMAAHASASKMIMVEGEHAA